MKKSLVFCMAVILALTLVACTDRDGGNDTTSPDSDKSTESNIVDTEKDSSFNETEKETEKNTEGADTSKEDESRSDLSNENREFTLRSDTGTGLNLVVKYDKQKNSDGSITVDADIYLESYSLSVTARGNTNYLKIGDESFYFSTDAIDYKGESKKEFKLASHKFNVSGENVDVYAVWNFNGSYSDKPISAVIINTKITL